MLNLACSLLLIGTAHPFHVSIATADWNAKSGKLEVSLRCHPSDLEQILRERTKKPIDIEKAEDAEKLITEYLAESLKVTDAEGEAAKLEWVGKELTEKYAWLYFEIPLKGGPDGAKFQHTLFFDLLDDQENLITVRDGKRKKSYSFTRDRSEHTIRLSEDPS